MPAESPRGTVLCYRGCPRGWGPRAAVENVWPRGAQGCGRPPGGPTPGWLSPEPGLRPGRGWHWPLASASAAGSGREEIREAPSAGR